MWVEGDEQAGSAHQLVVGTLIGNLGQHDGGTPKHVVPIEEKLAVTVHLPKGGLRRMGPCRV